MKKSLIALSILALSGAAFAEFAGTSASNSNGVVSQSGAFASSAGNGASFSSAGNTQYATSTNQSSAFVAPGNVVNAGGAQTSGHVVTGGGSYAGNVSIGNATGNAAASGASVVNMSSGAYYNMHTNKPVGNVNGSVGSVSESGVTSGKNGLAVAGGQTTSDYSASSTGVKIGNSDKALFNQVTTNANASSVSNSGGFSLGTGAVTFNNTFSNVGAGSFGKSGNSISNN